jgi:hypothetical protein
MIMAAAYRILSADQIVNEGPTLLTGIAMHVAVDGGGVAIYDGLDALSGALVLDLEGWANDTNPNNFTFPILLNNGLFVDIGSNIHHVTVFYIPLRGNSPLQPYPGFIVMESDVLNG